MAEIPHLNDDGFEKYFGFTKMKTIKLSYEWKIYNFSVTNTKNGEYLESPHFSSTTNENIKCFIWLYPRGENKDEEDFLSIYLHILFQKFSKIEGNFTFSILNKKGDKSHKGQGNNLFTQSDNNWGFQKYVKRSDINKTCLINDCLTIFCDITLGLNHVSSQNLAIHNSVKTNEKPLLQLLSDYGLLFNNQEYSDIKIIISDKTLYAHKVILAAHSPVFLAMFNSDMKENNKNEIQIADIEFDAFQELLRFIYTGTIKKMDQLGYHLLRAADKYAIKGLLTKCELYFQSNLNLSNVIHIICLADNYNAANLKEIAINFFIKNKKDIDTNNSEFLKMLKQLTTEEIAKLVVTT